MEHGDEIYSLCQVPSPVVVEPAAVQDELPSSPSSPQTTAVTAPAIKKSSTEGVFKPKCLVDSTTFLLPAGDGSVYLDASKPVKPKAAATTTTTTASFIKKKPVCSESPKAATANIFAPRTKDMNKGFLTFSDDDTGLTSEPITTRIFSFFRETNRNVISFLQCSKTNRKT